MRMRPGIIILPALVLALATAWPAKARGDDDKHRAGALFREGNQHREAGRHREALSSYEAAYKLLPSFKIDYNLALTLEKLGQLAASARRYARFLRKGKDRSPEETVNIARRKLAELAAGLGQVVVQSPVPGAIVAVDGQEHGRTPLQDPLYLTPGKHRVRVSAPGRVPHAQEVTLRAGQRLVMDATLQKVAEPAEPGQGLLPGSAGVSPDAGSPEEPASLRRGKSIWAWSLLGTSLACAAGAGVLYGVGYGQSNAAYDEYRALSKVAPAATFDAHWEEVEAAERLYIGGHVLAGVAAVALGVSIYQFVTRSEERPTGGLSRREMHLELSADARSAGLLLSGGF